ncbi:MAG: superoxide dismutase [candidate division Zixibacteria bacterium]|nr:superoxide dismutase [candidate division Zixibacteria bacterium]
MRKTRNVIGALALATVLVITIAPKTFAHCQVPCGIYGDQMRFEIMVEHIATIEKSMNQIIELSSKPGKNANQLVRWVNNKDEHADKISEIVSYYFLAQRIKEPGSDADVSEIKNYQARLNFLHRLTVSAMKCKQTTDLGNVGKLRAALEEFADSYLSAEDRAHLDEHHGWGGDGK